VLQGVGGTGADGVDAGGERTGEIEAGRRAAQIGDGSEGVGSERGVPEVLERRRPGVGRHRRVVALVAELVDEGTALLHEVGRLPTQVEDGRHPRVIEVESARAAVGVPDGREVVGRERGVAQLSDRGGPDDRSSDPVGLC
jgi:hypothetical protein